MQAYAQQGQQGAALAQQTTPDTMQAAQLTSAQQGQQGAAPLQNLAQQTEPDTMQVAQLGQMMRKSAKARSTAVVQANATLDGAENASVTERLPMEDFADMASETAPNASTAPKDDSTTTTTTATLIVADKPEEGHESPATLVAVAPPDDHDALNWRRPY